MPFATLTSKGQLTVPKEVRERLGLHPGDKVYFLMEDDRTARIIPKSLRASDIAGMLSSKTKVKATIEEMDEAVAEAFREGEL